MSLDGTGQGGGTACQIDEDFAMEILASQIVVISVRNMETVADKD